MVSQGFYYKYLYNSYINVCTLDKKK